ncbi:MAG: Holliday junction branch migration protein RuvA [Candidatus Brocadiia bacterium]
MIEFLQGELAGSAPDAVVLRVGGVAFSVQVPLSTYDALPGEGAQCRLLTHLHVREDELSLYGFATAEERQLFRMLLPVSHVGPAVALRVLSACNVAQFKRFILDEDSDSLKTLIKGIGAKTARRLVLELQEPVKELAVEAAPSALDEAVEDAIQALVTLGEPRARAERAVLAAREALGAEADHQSLVQEALSGDT